MTRSLLTGTVSAVAVLCAALSLLVSGCGSGPTGVSSESDGFDARLGATLISVDLGAGGMRVVKMAIRNLSSDPIAKVSVELQVFDSHGSSQSAVIGHLYGVNHERGTRSKSLCLATRRGSG